MPTATTIRDLYRLDKKAAAKAVAAPKVGTKFEIHPASKVPPAHWTAEDLAYVKKYLGNPTSDIAGYAQFPEKRASECHCGVYTASKVKANYSCSLEKGHDGPHEAQYSKLIACCAPYNDDGSVWVDPKTIPPAVVAEIPSGKFKAYYTDYTAPYGNCTEKCPKSWICMRPKGHEGPHQAIHSSLKWSYSLPWLDGKYIDPEKAVTADGQVTVGDVLQSLSIGDKLKATEPFTYCPANDQGWGCTLAIGHETDHRATPEKGGTGTVYHVWPKETA